MKAIILAAGEGNRLRPLTENIPKCMVKLFGKPLLEWQLDIFHDCNIDDISVITGYKNEIINYPNIKYYNNPKFSITNMVETLFCARNELNDDIIISYGDIIFEKNILNKLLNSKYETSIIVDQDWKKYWQIRFSNIFADAESLQLNDNIICDIGKKVTNLDKIHGQYIGLMKFSKKSIESLISFYDKIKKESLLGTNPLNANIPFEKSYMTDLLRGLIHEDHQLHAIFVQNGWLELDSVEDYELYSKMYKNKTLNEFFNLDDT